MMDIKTKSLRKVPATNVGCQSRVGLREVLYITHLFVWVKDLDSRRFLNRRQNKFLTTNEKV
jgi:hypothetical protein